MPEKKHKTALIGCGRIGFLLENDPLRKKPCTHFGGAMSAGIRIDCACDIDAGRLKKFAETARLTRDRLYSDYRQLLDDVNPELVIIATWTESHADIGIKAANSGARVIVCEKPVSYSLHKARELLDECKKNDTALIINHERRYDPRYRAVRKLIQNGKIGEVKTVHASILTGPYQGSSSPEEGGGPLLHDGTHLVDIIRYFFGEITALRGEISRQERKRGYEDRAVAWLKTAGGIDVFLEAGGCRNYFMFELSISGTEGKIVIGNGYEMLFINRKSRFYTGFRDLAEIPFPRVKGMNYFKREYLEAKDILRGKPGNISSSGLDGYRALEAIHGIYLSSRIKEEVLLPVEPERVDLGEIFTLRSQ